MGVNALKSHAIGDRHHFILQEQEKISFFLQVRVMLTMGWKILRTVPVILITQ